MLSLYMKYRNLKDRLKDECEGQGIVEYVLIIVLISLVAITSGPTLTEALVRGFGKIVNAIDNGIAAT